MKPRHETSDQKLRGGYYTPPEVVQFCLHRIKANLRGSSAKRWLEPAAGDGAFIRGLSSGQAKQWFPSASVLCIEIDEAEAAKCRNHLISSKVEGEVIATSFLRWFADALEPPLASMCLDFDAVVGNPPYLRYQFLDKEDRIRAERAILHYGLNLHGVSNGWIAFALLSLFSLRVGGAFALVLPSELLSITSAAQFRNTLVRHCTNVRVDLFPRSTFHVLQDVVVVSGRRTGKLQAFTAVKFVDHRERTRAWTRILSASEDAWTMHLLTDKELNAYSASQQLPSVYRLGKLARIQVSVVTGANDFFTVDDHTLTTYALQPWARPLLAKTSHSPGLRFSTEDFEVARASGARSWLLDFSASHPSPERGRPRHYLAVGESHAIPARYKCKIRDPWYRVPHIEKGTLMMTKRAHQHHRILLNEAGVFTTDTVYRGSPVNGYKERDLVAMFHNSLTLLSAEVEGRTYGGGVLELVPSEIAKLTIPYVIGSGKHIDRLDHVSRKTGGQKDDADTLVQATNELLQRHIPEMTELLPALEDARVNLRRRRFGD